MSLLDRILLPVDFSDRSTGAIHYIEAIAAGTQAEIHLIHVSTPLSYDVSALDAGGSVLTEVNADRSAELKDQLDRFLAEELAGYRVQRSLLEGDPAKRIVEFAHSQKINLIVMPTHGYGLFRRFLLGSVTAKVLHDADCPVWTGVHIEEAPAAEKIHFRKVLIAVDLCATQALKALSWGAQFADRTGAEVAIVHAYPSLEGRSGEYFDPNWRSYFTDIASQEIRKMQSKLGMEVPILLEGGDIPQVVCNAALTQSADLLVIGRGSAAGMFGRLRANAYSIIRQSPCPVVSV